MLNVKIDEAMLMYLSRATANENLNAKAKEFAEYFRCYSNTLTTEDEYELFHGRLEVMIKQLNEKYPRTKPFELYCFTKGAIYICPKGKPDINVASMSVYRIKNAMVSGLPLSVKEKIVEMRIKDK